MPSPDTAETQAFPLLADPDGYRACRWDLRTADDKRAYWLDLFRDHFPKLLAEALREAEDAGRDVDDARQRGEAARQHFEAFLDRIAADPMSFQKLDIIEICYERERALRRHGIEDPYRLAKQVETEQALTVLPKLLAELDALEERPRREAIIQGIFAGNIFDLGATKTTDMFTDERVNFHETRGLLKPRPWFIDGLDAWLARLDGPAHRAAVLFVDNAGPDVTLGMLPLARQLLRRGTRVILTANTHPSLNDITHGELVALIDRVAEVDAVISRSLKTRELRLVPSGNWAPLIDLGRVSPKLAAAVEQEGVDLVVLEGMGRAVESNLDAVLTCDCLKIAMIKDEGVSEALGAGLFDLVMKFEPAVK